MLGARVGLGGVAWLFGKDTPDFCQDAYDVRRRQKVELAENSGAEAGRRGGGQGSLEGGACGLGHFGLAGYGLSGTGGPLCVEHVDKTIGACEQIVRCGQRGGKRLPGVCRMTLAQVGRPKGGEYLGQ